MFWSNTGPKHRVPGTYRAACLVPTVVAVGVTAAIADIPANTVDVAVDVDVGC